MIVAFLKDLSTDPSAIRGDYADTALSNAARRGIEEYGDDFEIAVRRAGTPTYYSPAGVVSTVRAVSLAKFAPEDELSIASENWVVFPIVNKRAETGGTGDPHASGNVGFAVRKTV